MSPKHFFKKTKKNTSDNEKKDRSPSNSRRITDPAMLLKIYRGSLKAFIVLTFVLAAVIVGFDLDANIRTKQSIDLEREKLTQELTFWEDFIAEHKDYKDAYFQASVLKYKLGDASNARKYVEKGLALDPNSQDGRRIEDLLSK